MRNPQSGLLCLTILHGGFHPSGSGFQVGKLDSLELTGGNRRLKFQLRLGHRLPNACDGFGRELLNPVEVENKTEEQQWSALHWGPNRSKQNVFYVHGSLPLFDTGTEVEKEQYDEAGYLLENIRRRIEVDDFPVFVTAGTGDEKLAQIRANPYLADCYDHLSRVDGSVITFGFAFGDSDAHIVDALNRATHFPSKDVPKLWSIYIGVFSEADMKRAAALEGLLHAKVNTYNAQTAGIWG